MSLMYHNLLQTARSKFFTTTTFELRGQVGSKGPRFHFDSTVVRHNFQLVRCISYGVDVADSG